MSKLIVFLVYIILSGCVFDSGSKDLVGEYNVRWIDTGCTMTIARGPAGLMEGQIYHLGWNEDFIIAKRHPECKQDETDYFIIDIKENQIEQYSQTRGVYGPLTESQFKIIFTELGIQKNLVFNYEP